MAQLELSIDSMGIPFAQLALAERSRVGDRMGDLVEHVVDGAKIWAQQGRGTTEAYKGIDSAATSLRGVRALRRYLKQDGGRQQLQEALAARLPDDGPLSSVEVAAGVVSRIVDIYSLQRLSEGERRRALACAVGPISASRNPFGPVAVVPTIYPTFRTLVPVDSHKVLIRYLEHTPSDPQGTLLLLHGHGSSLEEVASLIPHLGSRYRIIAPDLPGTGYSQKENRQYTVAYLVNVLEALLRRLRVDRCYVAGGSLGGNIALRFGLLASSSERFPRLVAWAPAGWIEPNPNLAEWARQFRSKGPLFFWASYHLQKRKWYDESWTQRDEALAASDIYRGEVYSRQYHRAYFDIAADQLRTSLLARAQEIRQPVLLMCGRNDNGLNMYRTVRDVLWAQHLRRDGNEFFDDFEYGLHSVATMEPRRVAHKILQFLER